MGTKLGQSPFRIISTLCECGYNIGNISIDGEVVVAVLHDLVHHFEPMSLLMHETSIEAESAEVPVYDST